LAVASIAVIALLQNRASGSRDSEVALSELAAQFDTLQNVPYDSIGVPRAEQAAVTRRLRAGTTQVRRGLAELRRDSPTVHLVDAGAPFGASMTILEHIRRLLVAGRGSRADILGRQAGRIQRKVDAEFKEAESDYEKRAAGALRLAQLGSGTAILVLASLFALAYRRSRRAHVRSIGLAAENQLLLWRDAQVQVIQRLALAVEYRDDETGDHTHRVGDMAADIAVELGMSVDEVVLLRQAAPLHDVGKIGIPDSILLKPGRLTDAEFAEMKRHTTFGAEMLADGQGPLLEMAERIALAHHERWDGTGYPLGLSGDDIPLVGRIVAIADVYDALTHSRPYKEAWEPAHAIAEIRAQAGRQFDPQVVRAFLAVVMEVAPPVASPAVANTPVTVA
jgi:HD-GYP domain-containing protein (c-di-GMP phosphodiesterase class II)